MKKLFLSIFFLIALHINAQQDVQYTHYMYNMNLINPAYTTDDYSKINTGLLHRMQWNGIEGNLNSSTAFAHIPLKNNLEVGVSFLNDNINKIVKENNFALDIAYKLQLTRYSKLSFGIKTGANFLTNNFSNFLLQSGDASTDPSFANNLEKTFFSIGAGLYYNTDKMYVGLSVPNFVQTKHFASDGGTIFYGKEEIHAYLTGGYVFSLNDKVKLKPSFLLKRVTGAPLSVDINANAIYEKIEFGLGYRISDAITGMVTFNVNSDLRIGYSYDYNVSRLNDFNSGSHEFILLYNINTLFKGYEKSPRYF